MATVSALLKSAATTKEAVANYNDSVAAFNYQNSAYSDDAFQTYKDYLNGRINSYSGTGGISTANKVLSLTKTLDSATKSNITATITRENIQVLSGNASPTDKYNVIASQYVRAVNNGDLTLAQSLETQAYSLSQKIQYDQQQAANAAATLATSTAAKAVSDTVSNINQRIQNITASFKDLNSQIKTLGIKGANDSIAAWVKQNSDTLAQMGVVLPKGAQPNYFDLASGIQGYMYNAYQTAASALMASNPNSAQDYLNKAQDIANGTTKLGGLAGSMTASDIMDAANNPKEFKYDPSQGTFVKTQISGVAPSFHTTSDGVQAGVSPVYSGSIIQVVDPQLNIELKSLGLNYATTNNGNAKPQSGTNGVQVEASTTTDPAIKKIIQAGGGSTTAYYNPDLNNPNNTTLPGARKGGIQFQSSATGGDNGNGQAVYSVVYDSSGKKQVYESGGNADKLIYSDQGYNDGTVPVEHQAKGFFGKVGQAFHNAIHDVSGLFNGHVSADGLPSSLRPNYTTGSLLQMASNTHQAMLAAATPLQAAPTSLQGIPHALPPAPVYQAPPINVNQAPASAHINIAPNVAPKATISTKPINNNPTITVQKTAPKLGNITF